VKKIHRSRIAMFQNENVSFFQTACRKLGVAESNLFALTALREGTGPLEVIRCVLEVKRLDTAGLLTIVGGSTVHRTRQLSMEHRQATDEARLEEQYHVEQEQVDDGELQATLDEIAELHTS